MMEVLKVPGLLFVAKELCCLKLGQRDLETEAAHRGLFGRPRSKWRRPSLVRAVGPCSRPWSAAWLGTQRLLPPAGLSGWGVSGGAQSSCEVPIRC